MTAESTVPPARPAPTPPPSQALAAEVQPHIRPDRVQVLAELRSRQTRAPRRADLSERRAWPLRLGAILLFVLGAAAAISDFQPSGESGQTRLASGLICTCFALGFAMMTLADRRERRVLLTAANTDLLTGLPNRRMFMEELSYTLRKRSFVSSKPVALLLIDLDRFKLVNDSLGHSAGDDVLKEAASRLRESCRPSDKVCRLGGDEFVVIRSPANHNDEVAQLARTIVRAFERPFSFHDQPATVTASVGVAMGQPGHIQPEELLIRADAAMYQAKDDQVSGLVLYKPETRMPDRTRLKRESELRTAIDNDELVLLYQPQYNLATLELVGFEALIRWNHPELGLLTPDKFIVLAEESRLINELSLWVVREAFQQVDEWHSVFGTRVKLSLNLSALDLRRTQFLAELSQMLDGKEQIARDLVFEITETVLLRDPEGAAASLREIQAHGAKIAIDDFGTGYCSLAYVSRLPVEILKIDRSFVAKNNTQRDINLLHAIVELGHSLEMSVILEGIESQHELGLAIAAGCEIGQGYFLGKPMGRDQATSLLITRSKSGRQAMSAPEEMNRLVA